MPCPFCSSPHFGEIKAARGDSFALTEVSLDPPVFHPEAGMPVRVYGCEVCKRLVLECDVLTPGSLDSQPQNQ